MKSLSFVRHRSGRCNLGEKRCLYERGDSGDQGLRTSGVSRCSGWCSRVFVPVQLRMCCRKAVRTNILCIFHLLNWLHLGYCQWFTWNLFGEAAMVYSIQQANTFSSLLDPQNNWYPVRTRYNLGILFTMLTFSNRIEEFEAGTLKHQHHENWYLARIWSLMDRVYNDVEGLETVR